MNLSLTHQLEIFIRECAESGDYNNASEVVRDAIRLFKRTAEERPHTCIV
jgi:putative addiction module CopG family antidote